MTAASSRPRRPRGYIAPKERDSQRALFEWAERMTAARPELACLYAIPNAGGFTGGFKKNMLRVIAMRREGVKKGVPDVHLPVARGGYHSLYVEMKKEDGGKTSADQNGWAARLAAEGNLVVVAHGFDEARDTIEAYLGLAKATEPSRALQSISVQALGHDEGRPSPHRFATPQ